MLGPGPFRETTLGFQRYFYGVGGWGVNLNFEKTGDENMFVTLLFENSRTSFMADIILNL